MTVFKKNKKTIKLLKIGMFGYTAVTIPKKHQVTILELMKIDLGNGLFFKKYYYDGKNLAIVFFSLTYTGFFNRGVFIKKDLKSIVTNDDTGNIYRKIHQQWLNKIKIRKFREGWLDFKSTNDREYISGNDDCYSLILNIIMNKEVLNEKKRKRY